MTITTEQCKYFILSISRQIGENLDENWKRTKKYKHEDLILRDFTNMNGRVITIAQDGDNLFLYQLSPKQLPNAFVNENVLPDELGMQFLGHKAILEDLKRFIVQCVTHEPSIVDQDAYNDAIDPKNWALNWDFVPLDEEDYNIDDNHLYYSIENLPIASYDYKKRDRMACYIQRGNLHKMHCVFMPNYDTAYRITIYETKDHCLFLGLNNPD